MEKDDMFGIDKWLENNIDDIRDHYDRFDKSF